MSGSTPRLTSARTVSVGTRSRRQTSGNSCSSTMAGELLQRHHAPARRGHLQRRQRLERRTLGIGGAHHGVDQVDVVAHLRHHGARDGGVQHSWRCVVELTPSWRAWSWLILMRNWRAGSIQSKCTCRVRVSVPTTFGELQRQAPHLVLVRAGDAVLQRPAHGRAQFERRDARDDAWELLGQHLFQLVVQPLARLEVLGHDDELAEEGVGQLHVQRQDEADRAATDVAAEVVDVGVGLQESLPAA